MAVSYHDMTASTAPPGYGSYYSSLSITANTDKRDVSEVLDLWAHRDTPFLNRLGWGAESGGLGIEWVSEHLGWGYVEGSSAIATGDTAEVFYDPARALTITKDTFGIQEGALLYTYSSADAQHGLLLVESIDADGTTTFEFLSGLAASTAASAKFYIIGNFANEGSAPRPDSSRARSLLSNCFTILRKDINMTGTQQATDMWAVSNELNHQTAMRLLELQREREMTILYSALNVAKTTTEASLINGVFGFLRGQSGSHIDTSTTVFTESSLNTVIAECWENGGTPNVVVGNATMIRKFTSWNEARIRTATEGKLGGSNITKYLSDIGLEVDLMPLRKVPKNLLFVLDTSAIKPRAKKGRKLIIEKLGKMGDYDRWQLLSEFSLEFVGYDKGKHGMFTVLAS